LATSTTGLLARRAKSAKARSFGVDHEHQRVGKGNRDFGLFLHPRGQRALGALVEAGGIDEGEFEIAQTPFALAAVAGDAGLVIDQRQLLSDQPIEQRRFSDIGPADNGNRERHKRSVRPWRLFSKKACSGLRTRICGKIRADY
jgi:hypothetical protein